MSINMENLLGAFEILGFGWFGVFVVAFVLYAVSLLLLKVLPKK